MGLFLAQFVTQLALLSVGVDNTYSLTQDSQTGGAQCYHSPEKPTIGVHIPSTESDDPVRKNRITSEPEFQQLRMFIHYDDSVNTELDNIQRNRLQNIVIPAAETFFESALSVRRLNDPILLDRDCSDGTFFIPVGEVRQCVNQCEPQTTCGILEVPEDHLKRCVECGGSFATCTTRPGSVDGSGVPDADIVIYVGTSLSGGICSPTSRVIAFASACQLENTLDRPIAGYINVCPSIFAQLTDEENIEVALHELTHVLAFSSALYPFYRDENGAPRTPRDAFGRPPTNPDTGFFQASTDTIATITYDDWLTRNGQVSQQVDMLVTPNIIEQAKIHFGCDDIFGVEVENQGGGGTALSHWEHRVLGNEAMTGFLLFNGPFSRITFGLFQDSGWYLPNYDLAQALAWGRNRGCSIPHGSCAEYIQNQQASQHTLSPFCNVLQDVTPPVRTCSVDRDLFAECNLIEFADGAIPSEFQYFNSGLNFASDVAPRVGGRFTIMDYCPFESPFEIDVLHGTSCSNPLDTPADNVAGETYGAGSRCIEHGQTWTRSMSTATDTYDVGVGCYQYSCSQLGVEIHLLGFRYLCSCEGEELVIDNTIDGIRYQGSFICPSCLSLCFDDLDNCANPEPDACPGQQTIAAPLPSNRVQCFQQYDSGSCSVLLGPSISISECCNQGGGNAYQAASGECIQCPDNSTIDGMIEIAVERSIYSVVEGNELEVCIVVLTGSSSSEFEVTAPLDYNSINMWISITVAPGDSRSCGILSIPDNMCLDKNDREFQIDFSLLTLPENTTIIFEQNNAWLFIVDDDIVQIGLQQGVYEVLENISTLSICMQLLEGLPCQRPVNARLYTMDGNAMAGDDYESTIVILSIPVGSSVGALACAPISILNDGETEDLEYFSVHLEVMDLNIKLLPSSIERVTINIKDDDPEFKIQFNADTPMVNGDTVWLSFSSTVPVDEATCSVTRLGSADCTSGTAMFSPFLPTRRRAYTGTITARAGEETLIIQRTFRSELTGLCDAHLINEGLTIEGQSATIQVQGTGPSAANRITEFNCKFDGGEVFFCGSNPIEVAIPVGSSQLTIEPQDNEDICDRLRNLVVQLQQAA